MSEQPEISKWANTHAVREVECPRCQSKPGIYCMRPGGRPADSTHGERTAEYLKKIGREEWDRRHSMNVASGMNAKARLDAIIRGTGKVGAVGSDRNVAGKTEGLTRWRD